GGCQPVMSEREGRTRDSKRVLAEVCGVAPGLGPYAQPRRHEHLQSGPALPLELCLRVVRSREPCGADGDRGVRPQPTRREVVTDAGQEEVHRDRRVARLERDSKLKLRLRPQPLELRLQAAAEAVSQ